MLIKNIINNPLDKLIKPIILLIPSQIKPNHLTGLRLILTIILVYLFWQNYLLSAFILFLFTAITDALDGALARYRNQATTFGAFADPIVDKIFILTMIILFTSSLPLPLVGLIIATEIVIAGCSLIFYLKKISIKANIWGKLKLNSEVAAIILLFMQTILSINTLQPFIVGLLYAALFLAGLATFGHLLSGKLKLKTLFIQITLLFFNWLPVNAADEQIIDWQNHPMMIHQQLYRIIIFFLILLFISWMTALLGQTKQWWLGGILGTTIGLFAFLLSGFWIFIFIFGVFGLIYDYLVSKDYQSYQRCEKGRFWCHWEFPHDDQNKKSPNNTDNLKKNIY